MSIPKFCCEILDLCLEEILMTLLLLLYKLLLVFGLAILLLHTSSASYTVTISQSLLFFCAYAERRDETA